MKFANSFFLSSGMFSQSYLGLSKYLNSKKKLSLLILLGNSRLGWASLLLLLVFFSLGGLASALFGITPANPVFKNSLINSFIIFLISILFFSCATCDNISLNTKRISPNWPPKQLMLSPLMLNSSISIKGNDVMSFLLTNCSIILVLTFSVILFILRSSRRFNWASRLSFSAFSAASFARCFASFILSKRSFSFFNETSCKDNNSSDISCFNKGNKLSSTKLITEFIFSAFGKYSCCMNKLVLYVSWGVK